MVGTVLGIRCSCLLFLLDSVVDLFQVSEQQLKEAVAQAVEGIRFGKERHQWSLEGEGRGGGGSLELSLPPSEAGGLAINPPSPQQCENGRPRCACVALDNNG